LNDNFDMLTTTILNDSRVESVNPAPPAQPMPVAILDLSRRPSSLEVYAAYLKATAFSMSILFFLSVTPSARS
jgi:hypothetical protein